MNTIKPSLHLTEIPKCVPIKTLKGKTIGQALIQSYKNGKLNFKVNQSKKWKKGNETYEIRFQEVIKNGKIESIMVNFSMEF